MSARSYLRNPTCPVCQKPLGPGYKCQDDTMSVNEYVDWPRVSEGRMPAWLHRVVFDHFRPGGKWWEDRNKYCGWSRGGTDFDIDYHETYRRHIRRVFVTAQALSSSDVLPSDESPMLSDMWTQCWPGITRALLGSRKGEEWRDDEPVAQISEKMKEMENHTKTADMVEHSLAYSLGKLKAPLKCADCHYWRLDDEDGCSTCERPQVDKPEILKEFLRKIMVEFELTLAALGPENPQPNHKSYVPNRIKLVNVLLNMNVLMEEDGTLKGGRGAVCSNILNDDFFDRMAGYAVRRTCAGTMNEEVEIGDCLFRSLLGLMECRKECVETIMDLTARHKEYIKRGQDFLDRQFATKLA